MYLALIGPALGVRGGRIGGASFHRLFKTYCHIELISICLGRRAEGLTHGPTICRTSEVSGSTNPIGAKTDPDTRPDILPGPTADGVIDTRERMRILPHVFLKMHRPND